MIRVLRIDTQERFELFYKAFAAGGNAVHRQTGGTRPREDRAKESKVIKALKAMSDATPTAADAGMRTLHGGGGTVEIDQKCHELVMKYLEAAPFPTHQSDELDDLLDWVSAAPSEAPK